ncbi:MAG: histidine kinase, partial [Thermoflexales bacterium]|nr:histidine kinase [Thermoflexales bacterium]
MRVRIKSLGAHLPCTDVAWIIIVAAALSALSALSFARWVGHPFPQFIIIRATPGDRWMVWAATPHWWSGIAESGLRAGDILIATDGRVFGADYMARFAALAAQGRRSVAITALRDGKTLIHTRASLAPLTLAQAMEFRLPSDLAALVLLILAVETYRIAPSNPLNRSAARCAALIAGVIGIFFADLNFDSTAWHSRLLDLCWVILASFVPATLLDFALRFTGDAVRWPILSTLRLWAWRLCALIAGLYAARKIVGWLVIQWTPWLGIWEMTLFLSIIFLLVVLVFYFVLRLMWLALDPRHNVPRRLRAQARIVLGGLLALLPVLAVHFYFTVVFSGGEMDLFWGGLDLRYFYLVVPLAFAFAILRYQTFGLESRPLVLALLIATGGILSEFALSAMRRLGLLAHGSAWVSPSAFVLGLVLASMAVAIALTRLIRRVLYRQQIAYEGVYRFNEALAQVRLPEMLPAHIARAIADVLALDPVGVWLMEGEGKLRRAAFVSEAGVASWPEVQPADVLLAADHSRCWPVARAPAAWQLPGAWMVATLVAQGQPLGVLVMGKRWDEESLSRHDLEMGALVAQQCALTLLAARQIDTLQAIPRQIALTQEHERERLARELHDTVQQVLGRVPIYLGIARAQLQSDPASVEENLQIAIADLGEAARMLRQIRLDLSAIQLNTSLETSLRQIAQRFQQRTGIEIQLGLPAGIDDCLAPPLRYAAFRIAQQALDNIEMHAEARHVRIHLHVEGQILTLEICDDGKGFDAADRNRAVAEGHVGLISMAARAQIVGGNLDIESAPNRGTRIVARLPLQPA